jgi:hypothetical protein
MLSLPLVLRPLTATSSYLPPEVLRQGAEDSGYDARKLDCWAFGGASNLLNAGHHLIDADSASLLPPDVRPRLRASSTADVLVAESIPSSAMVMMLCLKT